MIGSGPSGIDITRNVAAKAKKVIFSTHHDRGLIFASNVVQKPDVAKFKPNSVVFVDGTEENITTIMYCTGIIVCDYVAQSLYLTLQLLQAINIPTHF